VPTKKQEKIHSICVSSLFLSLCTPTLRVRFLFFIKTILVKAYKIPYDSSGDENVETIFGVLQAAQEITVL